MNSLRQILLQILTTRVAWPILITMALLCTASIVTLNFSSPENAARQQMFILVGTGVMLITLLPHFQHLGRGADGFLGMVVVLLVAVLFTEDIKGSHRWFQVSSKLQFQPSELAKIAFVLATAWYLRYRKNVREL